MEHICFEAQLCSEILIFREKSNFGYADHPEISPSLNRVSSGGAWLRSVMVLRVHTHAPLKLLGSWSAGGQRLLVIPGINSGPEHLLPILGDVYRFLMFFGNKSTKLIEKIYINMYGN